MRGDSEQKSDEGAIDEMNSTGITNVRLAERRAAPVGGVCVGRMSAPVSGGLFH